MIFFIKKKDIDRMAKRKILPQEALYEVEGLLLDENDAWGLLSNFLTPEQLERGKSIENVDEKESAFKSLYSLYDRLNQKRTSSNKLDERIEKAFSKAKDKGVKLQQERINFVVAVDSLFCIGKNNKLPWKQKKDLQHVKELTEGNIIVVGGNTFRSVGALPNREIRVLTKNPPVKSDNPNVKYYTNPHEAIAKKKTDTREIFIFGGQKIYELYFPNVTDIYITFVDTIVDDGDTFFPDFSVNDFNTREVVNIEADKDNEFPCQIAHLRKIKGRTVKFSTGRSK